jgi:hypothetical protein
MVFIKSMASFGLPSFGRLTSAHTSPGFIQSIDEICDLPPKGARKESNCAELLFQLWEPVRICAFDQKIGNFAQGLSNKGFCDIGHLRNPAVGLKLQKWFDF